MAAQDIKQGTFDIIVRLLNGPYAIVVIIGVAIYFWSNFSPEQIDRIKELQPLLNSSLGIALAIVVVVTYISTIINSPIKEMTSAVIGLKTVLHDAIESMEKRANEVDETNRKILGGIKNIDTWFREK